MSRIACFVLVLSLEVAVGGCGPKTANQPKSVKDLIILLRDPDPVVQSQAAYDLSQLGPQGWPAVFALIETLSSKNVAVRQNSALALGLIGPEARDAIPALTLALRDPEYGVRMEAATALGNIGPDAISAIAALEKFSRERDPCKSAQTALKKIRQ